MRNASIDRQRWSRWLERIGTARLLTALSVVAVAWPSLVAGKFSPVWSLVPIAAFVGLVLYHGTLRRRHARAERLVAMYRSGLARIEDRWMEDSELSQPSRTGQRFVDTHHVYAADLDLFGQGSLFQLLNTARTRMGEDALARWLLAPAERGEVIARQTAAHELRDKLELREAVAVLGDETAAGVNPDLLIEWANAPERLPKTWLRWIARCLAVSIVAAACLWYIAAVASPFFVVLAAEAALMYYLKRPLGATIRAAESTFANLDLLSHLLARLEREHLSAPKLQALLAELTSHHLPASQAIARLRVIVQRIESRRNVFAALIDVPLMITVRAAYDAEAWRSSHGAAVAAWLRIVGEFEALLALATYSYEHPGDVFPELLDGAPGFDARNLAHPLLSTARAVANDVTLNDRARVLLVSGSNMSGKSTLLRTVGINVVLAMTGAPVRATALRLSPLQVGASIRVNDSLHEGASRFYAEISRLRQIVDLTSAALPLLFLLDELLQGTNSADRRVGAQGIVRALLQKQTIGLVTTHDLALTHIDGIDVERIRNVHFQDEMQEGRMTFDYRLRDGVVTKSNALELMRTIGLNV